MIATMQIIGNVIFVATSVMKIMGNVRIQIVTLGIYRKGKEEDMWESPVNIYEIHEPIVEEINKHTEETIFKAIHRVGVDVNKEELIKAMQYDRNQYEKGYKDGYSDAIDELQAYKKGDCMNDCEHYDNCSDYIYSKGYNKAIDEFAEKLKEQYEPYEETDAEMCEVLYRRVDKIAEQLKGGAE